MNEHESEQDFINKVRKDLDDGLEQLDPSIVKRLQKSRLQALERTERKPRWLFSIPKLIPVGGFAALILVAVTLSLWVSIRPKPFPAKAAEEIEILAIPANLEMYKDLEFFQWLAQTHETR